MTAVNSCWVHNDETKSWFASDWIGISAALESVSMGAPSSGFSLSSLISRVFIWRSVYFCSSFCFCAQRKAGSICLVRLRDLFAAMVSYEALSLHWWWRNRCTGESRHSRSQQASVLWEPRWNLSIYFCHLVQLSLSFQPLQISLLWWFCFCGFCLSIVCCLINLTLKFIPRGTEKLHPSSAQNCQNHLFFGVGLQTLQVLS